MAIFFYLNTLLIYVCKRKENKMDVNTKGINYNVYNNGNNSTLTARKVITNIENSKFEKNPISDSVSFQAKKNKDIKVVSLRGADELKYDVEYNKNSRWKNESNIVGENIDVNFKTGLGRNKLSGSAYNHNLELEYACKGFNPNKMTISGKIDNKNVSLEYNIVGNNVNIEGDISEIDEETLNLINMLAKDYSVIANNQLMVTAMILID